jgi:hypothetical protein
MIIIKDMGNTKAEIHVGKGTDYHVLLLGAEMLIEVLVNERENKFDDVMSDIKYIYERDNKKEKENENVKK